MINEGKQLCKFTYIILQKKEEKEEGQGKKGRGKKRNVKNQGKGGKEWRRGGGEKMVKREEKGQKRNERERDQWKSTRKDNFNINLLGCPLPNS